MVATRRTLSFRRTALAAGAAVVLVVLSGCSRVRRRGGDSASSDSGAVSAAEAPAPAEGADAAGGVAEVASQSGSKDASGGTAVEQQKVISTGNVQLRSDDVGQAIFDVRKVVDVHGGTISEDDTETDKDGDGASARGWCCGSRPPTSTTP